MWLNTPASALKETNILYTDGHTDEWMDTQTDRQSQYTPKNIRFVDV